MSLPSAVLVDKGVKGELVSLCSDFPVYTLACIFLRLQEPGMVYILVRDSGYDAALPCVPRTVALKKR